MNEHHEKLREWAKLAGFHRQAGVELLIRGYGGRFAEPGQIWITPSSNGGLKVDVDELRSGLQELPHDKQRYLYITHTLISPWSEDDIDFLELPRLDRPELDLVLAALTYIAGEKGEGLHPWPVTA
jgi:hypothetical protein